MSAIADEMYRVVVETQPRVHHIASPISDWSRCGLYRNTGVPAWNDGDELCPACAAEYARLWGKEWRP